MTHSQLEKIWNNYHAFFSWDIKLLLSPYRKAYCQLSNLLIFTLSAMGIVSWLRVAVCHRYVHNSDEGNIKLQSTQLYINYQIYACILKLDTKYYYLVHIYIYQCKLIQIYALIWQNLSQIVPIVEITTSSSYVLCIS